MMNTKIKLTFIMALFATMLISSCKEDAANIAPVPTVVATVDGYVLGENDVVAEGTTLLIKLPSFNSKWEPTDLTQLKVSFTVKDGVLKNYANGSPNNFSQPVIIDIMDYLYNMHQYTVKVETYTPSIPDFLLSGISIEGISLLNSDVIITDNSIVAKVPTLTDTYNATNFRQLAITYNLENGTTDGFTNGDALDYSNAEGLEVKFKTITGESKTYTVKIEPVYVDKGPVVDPQIAFTAINLNWQKVLTESLTDGLELYSVNDFKPGSAIDKVSGYYAKLDLSTSSKAKLGVGYTSGASQNIKKWYTNATDKPIVVTNGGFFGGNTSYSLVIDNSAIKFSNIGVVNRTLNTVSTPYYPTRSAFGIMADGSVEVAWVYNSGGKTYAFDSPVRNAMGYAPLPSPMDPAFASIRKEWKPVTAIGGAPILVKNGNIVCTEAAEFCDQFTGNRSRTAIGVTEDNKIILLVLDEAPTSFKGFSMQNLAMIMKSLGCKHAINLDGGGSTAMMINGIIKNTPSDTASEGDSRAIPTTVLINKK